MKFCPSCGEEVVGIHRKCAGCGASLSAKAAESNGQEDFSVRSLGRAYAAIQFGLLGIVFLVFIYASCIPPQGG